MKKILPHFIKFSYSTVILSFFLPFILIKCNNLEVAKASGFDLAFGKLKEIEKEKKFDPNNPFVEKSKEEPKSEKEPLSQPAKNSPNYFIIAILVISIIGLILSFLSFREKEKILMVFSAIGIFVLLAFSQTIDSEAIKADGEFKKFMNNTMKISLQEGFYICLLGFLMTYIEPITHIFTDQEISNDDY